MIDVDASSDIYIYIYIPNLFYIPISRIQFTSPIIFIKKIGHPVGSSSEIKARYKIAVRFVHETKPKNSRMKFKIYNAIFHEERLRHKLNKPSFIYLNDTMKTRIKRGNLKASGCDSPLKPIKPKLHMLIKCINNIKRSLTIPDGINPVNDLIQGTPVQKLLIKWKRNKQCPLFL